MSKSLSQNQLKIILACSVMVALGSLASMAAPPVRIREKTFEQLYQQIAEKSRVQLPGATSVRSTISGQDLRIVRPTSSNYFYQNENEDEKELDRLTDEQIKKLYQLSQQYRNSPNRGELWLRLGELYSEKARRLDFRAQKEYDKRLKEFEEKKITDKPKLVRRGVEDNNRKAIQLYEWFTRDFSSDEKMDQALFFLGYNYMQLGEGNKAIKAYSELSRKYPKSAYVYESFFALGEYYFEKEQWKQAFEEYNRIIQRKSSRLYDFAMFKAAWCLHGMGRNQDALRMMEQVISRGDSRSQMAKVEGRAEINSIRLSSEARRDLVGFYSHTGEFKKAESYFSKWLLSEMDVRKALEVLAYRYATAGMQVATQFLFKRLIEQDPMSPKAFDYKYQIVQSYLSGGQERKYLTEIESWIKEYGPDSEWYAANKKDAALINSVHTLLESVLRNYILQRHQNAQNTRLAKVQNEAADGYKVYLASFPQSLKTSEMHFFYAELLYDMGKFQEAAVHYNWVVDNDPKSPYVEKATTNSLLTLEKALPSDKKIRETMGDEKSPQPLGPEAAQFEAAAEKYLKKYPNGDKHLEARFRVARLHAIYNQFDSAAVKCREIIKIAPGSRVAESAADLLLDIYETKKDYSGLATAAQEIIAHPKLSKTKIGDDARAILDKSTFKAASEMEKEKNYAESAKAFEAFAKSAPKGELVASAYFNAAINYERAGDSQAAQRLHAKVVDVATAKDGRVKSDSLRILSNLARQSGKLKEAADGYYLLAKEFPKDKEAADSAYNATLIYVGFNDMDAASKSFSVYEKIAPPVGKYTLIYEMAEALRRRGQRAAATQKYEEYLKQASRSSSQTVAANYHLATFAIQANQSDKANGYFQRVLELSKSVDDASSVASYVAEAKFRFTQKTFADLKAERIPADPKKQQAVVGAKLKILTKLNTELADVIKVNYGPMIVAALLTIGQANEYMSMAIQQVPVPKGLKPDELQEYQKGIAGVVAPFNSQALEMYKSAWNRSLQLEAYSQYSNEARRALARLSPMDIKVHTEVGLPVRSIDWMGL